MCTRGVTDNSTQFNLYYVFLVCISKKEKTVKFKNVLLCALFVVTTINMIKILYFFNVFILMHLQSPHFCLTQCPGDSENAEDGCAERQRETE